MGSRVARMFRNVNLENRVAREISKEKLRPAPRYESSPPPPEGETAESVHQKNDPLLSLLKSVYVESKDQAPAEASEAVMAAKEVQRRPLLFSFPGHSFGLLELTDVPKGKLTIAEALKALSSHQREPQTWTSAKIAQEFSLDLKDSKALVEFFVPFKVQIIPPKTENAKQIKAS